MNEPGEIILINSTTCAGKTTLTRELQKLSVKPYLATDYDIFIAMLAVKYVMLHESILQPPHHPYAVTSTALTREGFEVHQKVEQPRTYQMLVGHTAWNVLRGMTRAYAAMAVAGNNLVLGDIITERLLPEYCAAFKGLKVYFVGVHCSLAELERREEVMPNRTVGCARAQFAQVHVPGQYDLTVDTEKDNPTRCAEQILDFVARNRPKVFATLVDRYANHTATEFPVPWW
jgi:chloramphenicol 3-O phosphotransferase